ncbi:MAG: oxygenase MpaB family protein, partial [Bacteroidota bacterium]
MGKYSDNFLAEKRLKGDLLADEAITSLFTNANAASFSELLKNDWKNNDPLPKQLPKKLNTFFQKTQILPAWADNKKMKKATKFFANYSGDVMGLLGSLALPYCYAAADGAKVLYFSERIKKDTTKRLAETGQFVIDVLSPDAFEPEGKAIRSIQKVRLIHAAIRYHILKSGKWNKAWGYPINQEDMAG